MLRVAKRLKGSGRNNEVARDPILSRKRSYARGLPGINCFVAEHVACFRIGSA